MDDEQPIALRLAAAHLVAGLFFAGRSDITPGPAKAVLKAQLAVAEAHGDWPAAALLVRNRLVYLSEVAKEDPECPELMREAWRMIDNTREPHLRAFMCNGIGTLLRFQNDFDAAQRVLTLAMDECRLAGDLRFAVMQMTQLGMIAYYVGDAQQGRSRLIEALRLNIKLGNFYHVAGLCSLLCFLARDDQQWERCVISYFAGQAAQTHYGVTLPYGESVQVNKALGEAHAHLDDDAFEAARHTGSRMSLNQLIAYGLAGKVWLHQPRNVRD
ncbi:MAG: hypothetical protein HC853_00660 [Anaerolineae bacterium]|nr:hypothetical protein [Anaerolineae bacterium]